jgi:hypothetical protein
MSSNPMNQAIRAMGNRSRALPPVPAVPDIGQGTPTQQPRRESERGPELWECHSNPSGAAAESRTAYDAGQCPESAARTSRATDASGFGESTSSQSVPGRDSRSAGPARSLQLRARSRWLVAGVSPRIAGSLSRLHREYAPSSFHGRLWPDACCSPVPHDPAAAGLR